MEDSSGPTRVARPNKVPAREVSHNPQGCGCEGEAFRADAVWEWEESVPRNIFRASSDAVYAG